MANLPDITKTSSGFGGQLERFWNGLTGQGAENARTQQTNEYNLASTQATNEANYKIAQETNAMNERVAMQNLGFQKELQEYNKALQERIFEREDTSYQRTAQDMIAAGLNPLSMQGTDGSGEAISMQPLNNNFQAQQSAPMQAHQMQKAQAMMSPLQAMSNFASAVNSITGSVDSLLTGTLNRDVLRKQSRREEADFILRNIDKGVFIGDDGSPTFDEDRFNSWLESIDEERKHRLRELKHFESSDKYESDTNIERMITGITDWLTNGRAKQAWEKLKNQFPLLQLVDKWAKALMEEPEYEVTYSNGTKKTYKKE